MRLERPNRVTERVASTHERAHDAERLHARARAERDAEVRATRGLRAACEKVPQHADANELLGSIECPRRDAFPCDDRAAIEAVLLHDGLQRAHGADPPEARRSWLI